MKEGVARGGPRHGDRGRASVSSARALCPAAACGLRYFHAPIFEAFFLRPPCVARAFRWHFFWKKKYRNGGNGLSVCGPSVGWWCDVWGDQSGRAGAAGFRRALPCFFFTRARARAAPDCGAGAIPRGARARDGRARAVRSTQTSTLSVTPTNDMDHAQIMGPTFDLTLTTFACRTSENQNQNQNKNKIMVRRTPDQTEVCA